MRTWTIAFLCGVLILQKFPVLPHWYWIIIFIISILLIEFFLAKKYSYFRHFLRYLSAFILGFAWTLFYVHIFLSWNLPSESEGKPLVIQGYIASIPNNSENRISFLFNLDNYQSTKIKLSLSNKIQTHFRAGDKWQFVVKLKRIHGMMNPGGFDYESWALAEKIRASGYVLDSPENKLLESHWYHDVIDRVRQQLKDKIEANLPKSNTSPWIVALALGERQNISAENWEILRNTGTNHLMAIAGLHIGFISGFMFLITSWCWRRSSKLMLIMPAKIVGGFFALITALIYGALSGFCLPAERACAMLSIVLIALIMRRVIVAWQSWSLALLILLLINPLCVLTESFWLSFFSVGIIIYGVSGRLNPHNLWWKLGRIQWIIALGLMPIGIWLFQQCSLISFIANSIAIPWVGFIIVPFTLFGCFVLIFSAKLGGMILLMADKLLAILWHILTYFSHLPWANWYIMIPNQWILLAACIGIMILLLPSGFPGKWLGFFWILPLIFFHYDTPRVGDVWFTLLDVGQGLSAVVHTQNHVLVFDAGPKLSPNYDMGESVVAPYLRSIGIRTIDMLVISHPDNDHIGGAKSLFHYFKIRQSRTSTPDKMLPFSSEYCLKGESWDWDNVSFEFLYPPSDKLGLDNDSSCVLLVTNKAHQSILLTGDIEKLAENYLIQNNINITANILVAPHHGSKTSALDDFVHNVHPNYVLFPVGYRNRYHFPHPDVVEKYQQIYASLFETDMSGAIEFHLGNKILEPKQYRIENLHYWNFKMQLKKYIIGT